MPETTGQRRFLAERDVRLLVKAKAAFWLCQGIFYTAALNAYVGHYSRIRSLPSREWHGRTLYLVHCVCCHTRRGVPEYVLWHLVDPCHPICEYCARSSRVPALFAPRAGQPPRERDEEN